MNNIFFRFDQFLISKMLKITLEEAKSVSETERYEAYRICLDEMGPRRMAATETVKKWFGVSDYTKPRREALIQLFFALKLSGDEAREWMVKGALEPDFQVNDYGELIFLYGLQNALPYEQCLDMIDEFVQCLSVDMEIRQHNYTNDIWIAYGKNCHLDPRQFLEWMTSIKEDFKGYSLTVLEYFKDLKREILEEIKSETKMHLEELLGETGFSRIESSRKLPPQQRRKAILRYLRKCESGKGDDLSPELIQCLRELLKISETSPDSNAMLLAELYPDRTSFRMQGNKRRKHGELRIMDDKYLSDILNIGTQKEKEIRLVIQGGDDKEIQKQKMRCRLIQRQDLLPMILCVSQARYMRENSDSHYDYLDARAQFVSLANRIMHACNMASLNPDEYELDHMLFECFRPDEIRSFSEALSQQLSAGGLGDA